MAVCDNDVRIRQTFWDFFSVPRNNLNVVKYNYDDWEKNKEEKEKTEKLIEQVNS